MAEDKKKSGDDIQLEQDMDYQKREWRAERIAWGLMAAIMLLSAAGLTGNGPLSHKSVDEPGLPLQIEHDVIGRYQAPATLQVALPVAAGDSGTVQLRLGREFVENIEIRRIDPEPERVVAAADYFTFEFNSAPSDSMLIQIHYDPATMGFLDLAVGVDNAPLYTSTQFLFP